MKVAQRPVIRRAIVTVSHRLAVVHRMWIDGTDFRWGSEPTTAVAAA